MNKLWVYISLAIVALVAIWYFFLKGNGNGAAVEYRFAPVRKGELVRSINGSGLIVANTKVDVKSKAGGRVVELFVDEGSEVRKGDIIARIDPSDTQTVFDQAQADVTSSQARAAQARTSAELQQRNSQTTIKDAENQLALARIRLAKAEKDATMQPQLSQSAITNAKASVQVAEEAQLTLLNVTIPQQKREAMANAQRAQTDLDNAVSNEQRQKSLLELGYISQAAYEQSVSQLASARASAASAQQKLSTIESQFDADRRSAQARLDQAKAALRQAQINSGQDFVSQKSLDEARKNVSTAEIALQRARNDRLNNAVRSNDITTAVASAVRSKVALRNAQVQLQDTTVLAPRDGVVTVRYLEQGTIIPPGTSTFAQGTSIVELSDVSRLFVEIPVDEADIANVHVDQTVRIVVEAYPGQNIQGVVTRVNPSATTTNNITAIKVRVEITSNPDKLQIMPGMSASCEFLTISKPNCLIVPAQAIKRDGGKTYVRVKSSDPKQPETREVQIGESGNDGIEVLSGLKEGEEVVVAEIDLAELRDRQKKMDDAAKGGGLAGGMARPSTGGGGSQKGGSSGGGMKK